MKHFTCAIAAGLVLFSAHAAASPFSFQASSNISEKKSASEHTKGASLFEMTLALFGFSKASQPADQEYVLSYSEQSEQCPEKAAKEKKQASKEASKEKSPAGPEPIYFGF